jgi:hypothetical protein
LAPLPVGLFQALGWWQASRTLTAWSGSPPLLSWSHSPKRACAHGLTYSAFPAERRTIALEQRLPHEAAGRQVKAAAFMAVIFAIVWVALVVCHALCRPPSHR